MFQQYGAPLHCFPPVRQLLDENVPRAWIGYVDWPPRSAALAPLDFQGAA